MDKSLMDSTSYPQADDDENPLKCSLKLEKNEQTTFSGGGGGIGNGGSSVTTRSQRAAAASKSNEIMTGRRQLIDGSGVAGCLYKGHHHHNYQRGVVKTEPCTNVNGNGKVLCLPLHQTTPDTTGSPEGHPEYSLKRPAEDVDNNPEVHPLGGGSSPNTLQRPRSKRPRRMYTPDQVQVLEKMFMNNEYPTAQDRVLLSAVTQLSTEKVKVWFQNRRSRERRRRQNQVQNNATMKKMGVAPVVNPKPPPCFTLSHPAVNANPHALTLPKNFNLTHSSTARSITPPSSAPIQQQLAQVFSQSANYVFSHQMQADINNNNNNNNNNANNNMSIGAVAQATQFMRPAMGSKHPFSNMYAKLCPGSVQPAPAAAAAGSMATKDAGGPMHVGKSAETYTPLVPAWSQSWPMFPPAAQGGPPQLQKMMPMDDFCDNTTNRWCENPAASNLHATANYGLPACTGTNANQNKAGGFQDHYPYAAMIPAGYLPYGYPYYPPGMYQNPQMGLYPQQPVPPVSSGMPPYLGSTDTITPTTAKPFHPSQPMVSQSVRLALQRKLDNTQKCYNWHYQSPGQSTQRLLEPTYLDSQSSKGCDNNDALSDSSTLSSPERTSSPIKPLATSSPNSNHPVGCEVPFSMGDNDKGIDNNTVRMQDLWPQPGMVGEEFDKNNNNSSNNLNNNNNMDHVVPTPYPNVAGYYNDYTPPTSSSYSQPTTTPWGNVRVNHIGNSSPSYGFKLNPDWPITTTTSADRYSSGDIAAHMEEPIRSSSSSGCYQFNLSDPQVALTPSDYSPHVDPVTGHLPELSATTTITTTIKSYPASSASPPITDEVMTAVTGGSTGYSDISSNGGEEEEDDSNHPPSEMAPPLPPPQPAVQLPLPHSASASSSKANGNGVQQKPSNCSSGVASATSSHAVYVLSDTE